jgi:hypothetical protein
MFKLKRGFYLGLGIFSQLFICFYTFKFIVFGFLNSTNRNQSISGLTAIIVASLIALLVLAVIQLILYLLSHWHRENDSIIFYYFFMSLKKCKVVHHEYLGDFIIQIDNSKSREVMLFKQDWFGFENLNSFDLQDDPEVLAKNIKIKLDSLYSQKLYEDDIKNKFNQKVNKIMEWDGHLDTVTRRDDKLDKLGIK